MNYADTATKATSVDEALDWIVPELCSPEVTVYRERRPDLPEEMAAALIEVGSVSEWRVIKVEWDQVAGDVQVQTAYLDVHNSTAEAWQPWEPGWVDGWDITD